VGCVYIIKQLTYIIQPVTPSFKQTFSSARTLFVPELDVTNYCRGMLNCYVICPTCCVVTATKLYAAVEMSGFDIEWGIDPSWNTTSVHLSHRTVDGWRLNLVAG